MNEEITCRIEKDGKQVYSSTKRGIAPLLFLIDNGIPVQGGIAYDKIVGKAAALLYALMSIKEVHAGVLSAKAVEVFTAHKIVFTYETLAEQIINRKGDGVCPMEKTVENIIDPQAAFTALKAKLQAI